MRLCRDGVASSATSQIRFKYFAQSAFRSISRVIASAPCSASLATAQTSQTQLLNSGHEMFVHGIRHSNQSQSSLAGLKTARTHRSHTLCDNFVQHRSDVLRCAWHGMAILAVGGGCEYVSGVCLVLSLPQQRSVNQRASQPQQCKHTTFLLAATAVPPPHFVRSAGAWVCGGKCSDPQIEHD